MSNDGNFLIWDAHACFSFRPKNDLRDLERYRNHGVGFVSINVGMDINPLAQVIHVIGRYRNYVISHPDKYVFANRVDDVKRAKADGKLAIAFDLEGSSPLEGDLGLVSFFHGLGLRQMLLAYNKDNTASGGCRGSNGLTSFGRDLIREMNRVGVTVDLSHMSPKATFEAIELSSKPTIFSHSNPSAVWPHLRNITDEQMKACAAKGGVVGINGIDDFLAKDETTPEKLVEHIQYAASVVGPEHVGIGLDFVVDKQEMIESMKAHPDGYPGDPVTDPKFVEPESYPRIVELLLERFSLADTAAILGGNFLRVAEASWR